MGNLIHVVLGKKVSIADEALPLLFAADRADDTRRFIRPELQKGTIVVCDRYTYSSLTYQRVGMVVPFDIHWLKVINKYALTPDVVFYLDIEPEIGLNRVSAGRRLQDDAFFEDLRIQRRIREAYQDILGLNKPSFVMKLETNGIPKSVLNSVQLSKADGALVVGLDANQSESEVHEQIIAFVQWLISRQRHTVKRRRLAPHGVVPLREFTRLSEHAEV